MLRTEWVTLEQWLRSHVRPTVAEMKRGYVSVDIAGLHASGYNFADGEHVTTIMGLKINRVAALADSHYDYYDAAGNLLHTV